MCKSRTERYTNIPEMYTDFFPEIALDMFLRGISFYITHWKCQADLVQCR